MTIKRTEQYLSNYFNVSIERIRTCLVLILKWVGACFGIDFEIVWRVFRRLVKSGFEFASKFIAKLIYKASFGGCFKVVWNEFWWFFLCVLLMHLFAFSVVLNWFGSFKKNPLVQIQCK